MTTSSTFRILPEYAFIRRNTGFTGNGVILIISCRDVIIRMSQAK